MIDQYAKVVPNGLLWTDGYIPELRLGDVVRVRVTTPRNGGFHRKAFALFRVLHDYYSEAVDQPLDRDVFRKWLTMRAGFFDLTPDGGAMPKSISYSSMDGEEFARLYDSIVTFAIGQFLPEVVSRDELNDQVDNLLRGFG